MEKIRILVVLGNSGRGGAQTFAVNLLRAIDKNCFQIDFVFNELEDGYEKEIRELGSKIYLLPRFKGFNWINFNKKWNELLSNNKYDIIHGHVSSSASIYLKIAKKHGLKTILHSHSAGYRGNPVVIFIKKIFTFRAKKYADYWFSCSEKAAVRLFGKNYANNKRYYEIPNAINTNAFAFNLETRKKIREELGVSDNCFLVGHVGSLTYPKNHEFLLDIFGAIKSIKNDSKLAIVGSGPLEARVKNKAKKMNLLESIIFAGCVPNPNDFLMSFDLLIFPSRFEGLPVTIVEAQATGLLVLMSDVITTHVKITDLVNSMSLKEPAYVWAKKACELKLIEDRRLYSKTVAETSFDTKKMSEMISNIYMKIMEG